ncbi:MAG: hypothetical protein A2V70_17480 [Planctomycetes bacterium RBG_13_63_9]|nr:MAG: hypothetical protein A2V70_17480 [Planctomycetes bacterium RBG_13_63_9]
MMSTLPTYVSETPPTANGAAAPSSWAKKGQDPLRSRHADPRRGQPSRRSRDAVIKIASRRDELLAAFRLVYDNYVRAGLARPNPYRMRVTPSQLVPTTEIFVALSGTEVICTMSLVRDGQLGLPMETIYEEEVSRLRSRGIRPAEVSALACRQEGQRQTLPIVIRLMSLMAQCAQRRGVDQLLIAIHPRHARYYQRFTAFMPIGEERTYATVCDNPAVALALDLNRAPIDHPRLYKRFFGTPYPEKLLRYQPMSEEFRSELIPVVAASCAAEIPSDLKLLAVA